jgi:hypothetical protein
MLRKGKKLGHWRCSQQDGLELYDGVEPCCVAGWLAYKARVLAADYYGRVDLITDDGLLPLIPTCRKMGVARYCLP